MRGYLPQEVASIIIDAQRRNYENKTIPSYWQPVIKIIRYVNKYNHANKKFNNDTHNF